MRGVTSIQEWVYPILNILQRNNSINRFFFLEFLLYIFEKVIITQPYLIELLEPCPNIIIRDPGAIQFILLEEALCT